MSDGKKPFKHHYMKWRETELDVNVTGKAKVRITYSGREKTPREVSFELGKIAFEFPIKKKEEQK